MIKKSLTILLFLNFVFYYQVMAGGDLGALQSNSTYSVGLIFHTSGWGVNYTKTKEFAKNKQWIFSADLVTIKHSKEEKRLNPNEDNSKRYVYGKMNYFMEFRPSIGRQKVVFTKGELHGVQVAINYSAGVSVGLLRPVYLIINYSGEGGKWIESTEIYNPSTHLPDRIKGRASYLRGFDKTSIYPGIHGKFGVNFEYSGEGNLVRSIETGVVIDAYAKQIPIMAFTHNQRVFFTGYLSFNFGKKTN